MSTHPGTGIDTRECFQEKLRSSADLSTQKSVKGHSIRKWKKLYDCLLNGIPQQPQKLALAGKQRQMGERDKLFYKQLKLFINIAAVPHTFSYLDFPWEKKKGYL